MRRGERRIELEAVRSDGWYERIVAAIAPLETLANALGDALVALSLAGGFRVEAVQSDRLSGSVLDLRWRRAPGPLDSPESARSEEGLGDEVRGPVAALRTSVLAALVGDAEPTAPLPPEDAPDDPAAIRAYIGQRSVLLAPLFGLTLRELRVTSDGDARVVVGHDGIEEVVALKQLRRFLRQRVVEVLQADSGRAQVSIELSQADLARAALEAGRPEEAVARLIAWVAPLTVYHRTPDGQALDLATRARLARALGTLAEAFGRLRRTDERHEVLRLALQYALDGEAAPGLYLSLAAAMADEARHAEAIGPLRRALALGGDRRAVLPALGMALVRSGRAVAGLGCARALRDAGAPDATLERALSEALGGALDGFERWMQTGELTERTVTMPAIVRPVADEAPEDTMVDTRAVEDPER